MNRNIRQRPPVPNGNRNKLPVHRDGHRGMIKRDIVKDNDILHIKGDMDRSFFVLVIVLLCFGSIMVFSASYAYALSSKGNSYYFIQRQIVFAVVGIIAMLFIANLIDYKVIKALSVTIFAVICILLVLVLAIGIAEGSAQRWITIPYIEFTIQPSEFMKLGLVLMLAKYFDKNEKLLDRMTYKMEPIVRRLLKPLVYVGGVCAAVVLENHISGVIILFAVGIFVVFIAGGQIKPMAAAGIVFVVVMAIIIAVVPYARGRVDIWLNPEQYSSQDETWQTMQGLNAIGSGGFFGVGFGQSLQKHMFVSQPQNDFIFAIVCEELGFIGAVTVICLFAALVWRGMIIAMRAPDTFSKLTVAGIMCKIALQTALNIAVVTNSMPNTGISLPFFSYGGSSLIALMLEMGVVLSISRYSKKE